MEKGKEEVEEEEMEKEEEEKGKEEVEEERLQSHGYLDVCEEITNLSP